MRARFISPRIVTLILTACLVPTPSRAGLSSAPDWSAQGNQPDARFGRHVATAGDVNGDGYSDVIVGAHMYDTGGAAFVYHGAPSGISVVADWTAVGTPTAWFGAHVATAGDVNGDGYDDVVVGAQYYDNDQTNEGAAYVFHGSASGLSVIADWAAEGDLDGAQFGSQVALAGDVNGDGYDDVLVGAVGYANGESAEGAAFLYYGSSGGLSASPAWVVEGGQANIGFGSGVAGAGDVNADGYDDVIVGVSGYDGGQTNEGAAFLYLGSASGPSATPDWTVESNNVDALMGAWVFGAGDVNGDGFADVIVGAHLYGSSNSGRAYVYHGSATGLSASADWIATGQAFSQYGHGVSTAGDVNGDGYADIVVGAWQYNGGEFGEGAAFAYLGSANGLPAAADWMVEGDEVGVLMGRAVATAGDVNGDGFSDVIVGADGYEDGEFGEGGAFVYHGAPDGLAATAGWMVEGELNTSELGHDVTPAGDVNGDGYSDVIVTDGSNGGESVFYCHLGSIDGPQTTAAWVHRSPTTYLALARCAGDVNGDGYDDVIVGDARRNPLTSLGGVSLFLGSPSGLDTLADWSTTGDQDSTDFGVSVDGAGDVNGDGYGDVIVGARYHDGGGENSGRVFVYLGGASGLRANADWIADGPQTDSELGWSVASAGDVNGDGYSDVIVGAYDAGDAYIYLGSETGLSAAPDWAISGPGYGYHVASAGDVNADGFSDVLVTSGFFGETLVFHGGPSGPSTSPSWTHATAPGQNTDRYSYGAGDVNGDGFDDLATMAESLHVYLGGAAGLDTSPAWGYRSPGGCCGSVVLSARGAGDVNGDGFDDLIHGSEDYDGATTQGGAAFLFYGNATRGLSRLPRQVRADGSTSIALLGGANSKTSLRIEAMGRSAGGRDEVRLEWEVKPLGVPFDVSGTGTSGWTDTGPPDGSGSAVALSEVVAGLDDETVYHWRLRAHGDTPFFPRSPWISMPGNAVTEADLRTGLLQPFVPPFIDIADGALADSGAAEGIAWGDIDADGYSDLYVVNTLVGKNPFSSLNRLFWNQAGSLLDVPLGDACHTGNGRSAAWGDHDNDGDLDLHLTRGTGVNCLFRNDGGVLTEATPAALADSGDGWGAAWVDFDNDGALDLHVINGGAEDRLFKGDGTGGFVNVASGPIADAGNGRFVAWGDYDNDGDQDAYVSRDLQANILLRNDGGGAFTDVTNGPLGDTGPGCGVAWGDYDNDGDLDLYLANASPTPSDVLFRNEGNDIFTDVSGGDINAGGGYSQGVAWGDVDNDGDLDLYVSKGSGTPNELLINVAGTFVNAASSGLEDDASGRGVAFADFDRDGDLDLYLGNQAGSSPAPNRLFRNDLITSSLTGEGANNWLQVGLAGVASNGAGIGSRVTVIAGGITQIREVSGGSGYGSQDSPAVEFGLGGATVADTLLIRWPSGVIDIFTDVPPNSQPTYNEGESETGIGADTPPRFVLHPNTPNPFNPLTTIRYEIPAGAIVRLGVYDISGRLVRTLRPGVPHRAGEYAVVWDGRNDRGQRVASGVYLYRMEAGGSRDAKRMVLLK